ncbi:TetR family transcriptional regulator [Secundilactobacillus pentosiphilus]|uniref:TetR family transcriptional regulator n=1 Tax=Secundilactobacillus pentosiphilus TaxID=1714682 RepID=A0A1Z5ITP2_9LACO|nr:TetR/AcrR family transcriptional regulator [Secundilactobacillus pentosiphilus]GAX04988.1 TetR family transcriptional regulator [Secundilactobacillus pentosiphilus]
MSKNVTKSDQHKEKILEISREMFAKNGYEATTTRMINQEAGTAEGLMYYYFPHGKHEILDTIVCQGIINRVNQLQTTFNDCYTKADLEERLMKIFEDIWQVFQDKENYQSFVITIHERMLLSDDQADWLLQVLEGLVDEIAGQLKSAPILQTMPEDQYRPLARVIVSIFQKIIYDELLIKNNRQLTEQMKAQIRPQLKVVL